MFDTIENVIADWDKRFEESRRMGYKIIRPGYSERDIINLEKLINTKLHNSLKKLLSKAKLDYASFCNLHFGYRKDNGQISFLLDRNKGNRTQVGNDECLVVGATDSYDVLMNNRTGEILVLNIHEPNSPKLAAENLTRFICIAATIATLDWTEANVVVDEDWMNNPNDVGIKEMVTFLQENQIASAREFWRDLAFGWT